MLDWSHYNARLGINGVSDRDRIIQKAKDNFQVKVISNPGYQPNATRNGAPQRFLVDRTEVAYKIKVIAFPDENLYVGDILEIMDEHFIVVETRVVNEIHITGTAWLCNHLFRFQNGTSDIIERWGVLDSGVYSTTLKGNNTVQSLHKQFKVYLPYDEDTAKLYIDKRIAGGVNYDANGDEILTCYIYTGEDPISRSYGKNGHLLIMNVESVEYDASRDNAKERICDYIAPSEPSTAGTLCKIAGRDTLRIGSHRTYLAQFFKDSGGVDEEAVPSWSVTGAAYGIQYSVKDGALIISVDANDALIGTKLTVELNDGGERSAYKKVEVTG
jgi:hypothetical protein